ncbi:FAD-binding oxidoreductase [Streptomyces sp. NPDC048278]|uniref:FAD-binding oxidoreductase n=1 Tax=Streptomyces sp. NPDC048278 TaxID=3155809 RepID=UPI0034304B19
MSLDATLERKLLWSHDEGYERARRAAVWNGRKPDRRPAGIVLAEDAADVAAAVRLAEERGLRVSVRAGGHSYSAAGVREGALLVDVSRLRDIGIDTRTRTAVVGPGVHGGDLDRALEPHGLFFPTGHCPTVAVGGFLLGGGLGWNWRSYGPGCVLVQAVDVVTADGRLVRADASHNRDLYWAARGAGPGFFGVVTAFHLRVQPRPAVIKATLHAYPLAVRGELLHWLHGIRHEIAPVTDQACYVTQEANHSPDAPTALSLAIVFADSERAADEALAPFADCPVGAEAIWRRDGVAVQNVRDLPNDLYPEGHRYAQDNIMSSSPAAELVPALDGALLSLPTPRSHLNLMNLAGTPELPDMAFSLLGETLIELYSVWEDPARDAEMQAWVTGHARRLDPVAMGSQLSGESMASRGFGPEAFFSAAALSRLDVLRGHWDPDGRFVSFLL